MNVRKSFGVVVASLFGGLAISAIAPAAPSHAGEVLERIAEHGAIVAGARADSVPFGFRNERGQWVGYSLEMLERIRREAEAELGKPIRLELVEVSPQDRFQKIQDGSIDIECGSTTFTWEREREVDYTVSYFFSGTQLLVPRGSALEVSPQLNGKRVAVIPETTNAAVIAALYPQAQVQTVGDRAAGLAALEAGTVDAFASDGIVLEGLRLDTPDPLQWSITPEAPLMIESYACTVPEDESAWRDLANRALVRYMQGLVSDNLADADLYERWFGISGATPYPREIISEYFLGILNTVEWIP